MTDNIREKIKKLLALANDKGASENEAAVALEFATKLMMQHGIEQSELKDMKAEVLKGDLLNFDKRWHENIGRTASKLYGVKPLFYGHDFRFCGRADNIDAASQTAVFIAEQIEELYKAHLPRGMSKGERAEYRRDFKFACSMRVYARACDIVENLETKDNVVAQGCTALVVVEHRKQLEIEVDDFFEKIGVKMRRARSLQVNVSAGGVAGHKAGDQVRLQKKVCAD